MSWLILILGFVLWTLAHFFPRYAPDLHAELGKMARMFSGAGAVIGLVLIIWAFRATPFVNVWFPPAGMVHATDTLMLVALWLLGAGHSRVWPAGAIRHPMLWAVVVWAVGHLLVNGDLTAMLTFGFFLLWALAEMVVINRAQPDWVRPERRSGRALAIHLVVTLVLYALIAGVHIWAGLMPFGA